MKDVQPAGMLEHGERESFVSRFMLCTIAERDVLWRMPEGRGDFLLAAAESMNVKNPAMLLAALDCLRIAEADMGLNPPKEFTLTELEYGLEDMLRDNRESDRSSDFHWEGHLLAAEACLLEGRSQIFHGQGHRLGLYPSNAVRHIQDAYVMAWTPNEDGTPTPDGRAEGIRIGRDMTMHAVHSRLGFPSQWSERGLICA